VGIAEVRTEQDRRAELLDAAERAIRRRGPDASMDEIAAEAGVTKPILYRHFGDKDGLYAALVERLLEKLYGGTDETLTETNPRLRLAAGIAAFLTAVERDPQVFYFVRRATTEQRQAAEVAGRVIAAHAARIARATRPDLERIGVDPGAAEPFAHGIVGMFQFVAAWWLESKEIPRDRLVDEMTALLWEGFGHLHESRA